VARRKPHYLKITENRDLSPYLPDSMASYIAYLLLWFPEKQDRELEPRSMDDLIFPASLHPWSG
jgi:hypothetical protein